ncbi:MAG TPA: flagellar basal body rod protein FlgG, partial [Eubacteriaceae bacterium]|nr:flagellar basal body rod protein FlgG [Eubacteriaceae bacterium]
TGFFMVSQDTAAEMRYHTRDGVFYRDYEGNLVNANGYRVLGYKPADGVEYASPDTTTLETDEDDLTPLDIPNGITVGGNDLELESFSIDGSGQIIGVYSDGNAYLLGQLAVSKFNNAAGLDKMGNNNYSATVNSGEAQVGMANEQGYGTIRQGVVEMSNVDLANEFTEMIITSRSYQANSRTITTSDELLQELINLKR